MKQGVFFMNVYEIKKVIFCITLSVVSIADAITHTAFPKIVGATNIANVYIDGSNNDQISNLVLYVTENSNFTWDGSAYNIHPLMNTVEVQNGVPRIEVYSTKVQSALLNLTSKQWQSGIYVYPYITDEGGDMISSVKGFTTTPSKGTMRVAIFDSNWSLLADDQVGSSKVANGSNGVIGYSPGTMGLYVQGPTILHQDAFYLGNVFRVVKANGVAPGSPVITQSDLTLQKPDVVDVGAVMFQKGTISSLSLQLNFGSAGIANLNIDRSTSNMATLQKDLTDDPITFSIVLNPNAQSGYDAIVTAYQKGESIFEQKHVNLVQQHSSNQISSSALLSDLQLTYQTDSMQNPISTNLGKVLKFVATQSGDTFLEGVALAGKEKIESLTYGIVFEATTGLGGFYEALMQISTSDLALINAGLAKGQNVTASLNLVGTNIEVQVVSDDQKTVNIKKTQSLDNANIVNAATMKRASLPEARVVKAKNVGYKTSNMNQGVIVPNVAEYKFVSNISAVMTPMSTEAAPTGYDDGPTGGGPTGGGPTGGGGGSSGAGAFG